MLHSRSNIPPDRQIHSSIGTPPAPGRITNAMSVDVEDYYQVWAFSSAVSRNSWSDFPSRVEDNTSRILDLFAETGTTATFFTLGCVAEQHPNLIRRIVDLGHEVASHGYAHYKVHEHNPQEFMQDVLRTRKLLEDISGTPVIGYRAAGFSINQEVWWAFNVLAEAGYRYSSSIHPIRHDHYGMPNSPRFPFQPDGGALLEIPVATVEFGRRRLSCAGGGFFRLLPYQWSRWCLNRVNDAERQPATFYFHPWEIDPGQPRIKGISIRSRFRHYTNLRHMSAKLRRLLTDFNWSRIDAVYLPSH